MRLRKYFLLFLVALCILGGCRKKPAADVMTLHRAAQIGNVEQIQIRLAKGDDIATIPGTRRIERLEENWASQDITLRSEHLERLESLIDQGVVGDRY